MAKFKTIVDYLASLPGVSNARPVTVTIGRETYQGARYVDTRHYEAGMIAVQRGEREAGEPYTREWLYLLGDLPKPYQRSPRVAFTMPGDKREWYVAAYHDGKPGRFGAPVPAFGANFMLAPWDIEGQAIDHYDVLNGEKPYRRVACAVTE